jgi:aminoglycoside phosphotransferase (APT) family kinase protein
VTGRGGRSAPRTSGDELLSAETVVGYLRARGLLAGGGEATVADLGGGVSNVVLAVSTPVRTMVVKQALPKLRVADDWPAKRERAVTEADALRVGGELTPSLVPRVLDVDPDACALTIAYAPAGWRSWKELLLEGTSDPGVAERLGSALAAWHDGTRDRDDVRRRFGDHKAFDQLRVDPYYRTIQRRIPAVAERVGRHVELMLSRRRCLVHGDFSPKNVLVGADGLWVVDWEVAHFGDPAFDLAFMLNHLFLKALHRPANRDGYECCSVGFLRAYDAAPAGPLRGEEAYLLGHVGCLMLARVDGKSPAEYLTEREREHARFLGRSFVLDPPTALAAAWQRLVAVVER